MRLTKLAVLLLLGILLVSGVACGGGPTIIVPTVNYVPDGWIFEGEYHSETSDIVLLKYTKEGGGGCSIDYSSIPGYITQYEEYYGASTEEALLDYAEQTLQYSGGTDKESGMTTVCGHLAAYIQFTTHGMTIKELHFIEEETYFEFSINYLESSVEAEAMALINSITFD